MESPTTGYALLRNAHPWLHSRVPAVPIGGFWTVGLGLAALFGFLRRGLAGGLQAGLHSFVDPPHALF